MTFQSNKPNVTIWNGGKPIKFKGGTYETTDKGEIEVLKKVPYVTESKEGE